MATSWFPATFCPRDATCSLDDGLSPSNGPKIQSLSFTNPPSQPFPTEIRQFPTPQSFDAANTQPEDWIKCEGRLLSIAQYATIFSLLGTMYGGDGRTTFGTPDLRNENPNDYYMCINGHVPGFVGP